MIRIPIKYANYLKDGLRQRFFPITSEEAVVDENGVTLKEKLETLGGGGISKIPDNYVFVRDPGSNDIPETGTISKLDADTLQGHSASDFIMLNPTMRKNAFRGANLGSEFTTKQKAAIADGSFSEFFIGDYWEKDGIHWRIADMNYWIGTGNTACTTNHLVIVPDESLGTAAMNDTSTTSGGYPNSKMCTETIKNTITPICKGMFGDDSLLVHDEAYENALSNGKPTYGNWYTEELSLLNERMIMGGFIHRPINDGTSYPYNHTIDKTQLALFKLDVSFINRPYIYWLRDVVSDNRFAEIRSNGLATYDEASLSLSIRPVFGIHG